MPVHQVVQLDNHRLIPALLFLIAMRTGTQMNSLTCLTMADLMALDHMFSQAAFLIRRQSFFSTASLRASCTRLKLAYIRLSFAFSSSNSLRHLTSLASILPYFCFHLENVTLEIPNSRQSSSALRPDSCSLIALAICVSVNRDFFILTHLKLNCLVNFQMSEKWWILHERFTGQCGKSFML